MENFMPLEVSSVSGKEVFFIIYGISSDVEDKRHFFYSLKDNGEVCFVHNINDAMLLRDADEAWVELAKAQKGLGILRVRASDDELKELPEHLAVYKGSGQFDFRLKLHSSQSTN